MARDSLPDPLFSQYDLRRTLDSQDEAIAKAVEEYPAEQLASESEEQLVAQFQERFREEAPVLTEGAISVDVQEAQIDVSGSFDRDTMGQRPYHVPGVRVTYYVPFTGNPHLFNFSPSTFTLNRPRANVVGQELQFVYENANSDVAATKRDFDNELNNVRQYLSWIASDISTYHATLPGRIRSKVADRRARLERTRVGLDALGIPRRQPQRPAAPPPPTPKTPKASTATLPTYDVALSFAGENRPYVERVAEILKAAGLSVFYDGFEKANLWGKNLIDHLANIYQHRSRFVVMFVSKHYVEKAFPTHERQHAQARALIAKEEYILPARFDDTEVPGMTSTVAYVDLRKLSPEELAVLIRQKVGK